MRKRSRAAMASQTSGDLNPMHFEYMIIKMRARLRYDLQLPYEETRPLVAVARNILDPIPPKPICILEKDL